SMHRLPISPDVIQVLLRAEDRTYGSVVALKQPVAEPERRLPVVDGREKRRAPNVTQRRIGARVRRECTRISHGRVALMIEELNAKAGIDDGLIRIRDRASYLVQAEASKQAGFVRNLVVHAN